MTELVAVAAVLLLPLSASAQEAAAGDEVAEQIVVTGSHIKQSSFEGPSPVQVLSRDDFEVQQAVIITDLTKRLTANSGAEFQEDQFNANSTSGTASINLRGLGIGSTLVLLNGRRAVASPGAPNSGATFSDINNFPVDLIERIEIVKDGASAVYGSDAVAGVVNFITRKDFEGFELNGSWQGTTQDDFLSHDQQQDMRLGALFGAQGERTRMTANISWFNRSPLDAENRKFTQVFKETGSLLGVSGLGNPPTFIPLAPNPQGFTPGIPSPDPLCGNIPGGTSFVDGVFCRFQFAPAFELTARETRIDAYTTFEFDVTESVQIYMEGGFNFHRNSRTTSPSFPFLSFPVIGPENPGNPTNTAGIDPSTGLPFQDGAPVVFLGRAFGPVNRVNDGAEISRNELDTWRLLGGFKGNLGGLLGAEGALEDWEFDADYIWTQSRQNFRTNDSLLFAFKRALRGLGGTQCDASDPASQPGVAPCFFFNPFGTGILAQPGDPQFNDPDVLQSVLGINEFTTTTELQVVDVTFSNSNLFELPGGSVGFAAGYQFRRESFDRVVGDPTGKDQFAFVVGGPPASGARRINALFAELQVPFWKGVESQIAVRFEDYQFSGSTIDPKIGLRVRPFDMLDVESALDLTLRGNFSTAFRAPSLAQQLATQTVLTNLVDTDPNAQPGDPPLAATFRAVRTFGNTSLDNEESTVWSAGVQAGLFDSIELSVDWWRFDYEDIIVKPSAQEILDAAAGTDQCLIVGCRAIIRDPLSNQILRVESEFFNAASTVTDGFDISLEWLIDPSELVDPGMDIGTFLLTWDATFIRKYETQNSKGDPKRRVEGSRNFKTFASSIPDFRFNLRLIWTWENLTLTNSVQYITDYEDDECLECPAGQAFRKIDSFTAWDLTASYRLDNSFGGGTTLTMGLLNVLDEDPPPLLTAGGYDPTIHDGRGRLFQVGFTQRF